MGSFDAEKIRERCFQCRQIRSFVEFVKGIIEDYPFYKLRCVQNEGIAEKIAEYQDAAMLRDAALHKQAAPAVRGSLPVSRGMDEGR